MRDAALLENLVLHLDKYLFVFVSSYGVWAYALLFLIIFCETGLVITPFLPGDSLLFVAGTIAAQDDQSLDITYLFLILVFASWLGNQVNYSLGYWLGERISTRPWFNHAYLKDAHHFYQKHGKLTLILARFLPIIRTFVPFVAGLSVMNIRVFTLYNLLSALIWIGVMLFSGYFLGQIPIVKSNFVLFIYTIIFVSLLPSGWMLIRKRFLKQTP